jgi:histidinol dehydrogenase
MLASQEPALDAAVQAAIDQAFSNIEKFHSAQLPAQPLVVEVRTEMFQSILTGLLFS